MDTLDYGVRIDVQEDFFQGFYLGTAHGGNRGHALPVDVGGDHVVRVDNRQVRDARTDEPFRAPTAHAPHAK